MTGELVVRNLLHRPLRTLISVIAVAVEVTDAALAALAMENGGVLYSTDRDFRRFPGLKLRNPLDAA